MHSVEEVLALEKETDGIFFIAGGSAVYQEFLPFCTILYRTVIHHVFDGDAYFPLIGFKLMRVTIFFIYFSLTRIDQ